MNTNTWAISIVKVETTEVKFAVLGVEFGVFYVSFFLFKQYPVNPL